MIFGLYLSNPVEAEQEKSQQVPYCFRTQKNKIVQIFFSTSSIVFSLKVTGDSFSIS